MKIRKATLEDADFIINAQVLMAKESEDMVLDHTIVTKGVEHIFKHSNDGFYIIAQKNNRSIACLLVLKEWSDWRAGYVHWIHSVFVLPENRRSGVFSSMYKHLKDEVIANDELKGLRLYVEKENLKAIKTYEALGMSKDHYHMYEWLK